MTPDPTLIVSPSLIAVGSFFAHLVHTASRHPDPQTRADAYRVLHLLLTWYRK